MPASIFPPGKLTICSGVPSGVSTCGGEGGSREVASRGLTASRNGRRDGRKAVVTDIVTDIVRGVITCNRRPSYSATYKWPWASAMPQGSMKQPGTAPAERREACGCFLVGPLSCGAAVECGEGGAARNKAGAAVEWCCGAAVPRWIVRLSGAGWWCIGAYSARTFRADIPERRARLRVDGQPVVARVGHVEVAIFDVHGQPTRVGQLA